MSSRRWGAVAARPWVCSDPQLWPMWIIFVMEMQGLRVSVRILVVSSMRMASSVLDWRIVYSSGKEGNPEPRRSHAKML